jgi:hypothetical protein
MPLVRQYVFPLQARREKTDCVGRVEAHGDCEIRRFIRNAGSAEIGKVNPLLFLHSFLLGFLIWV